MEAHHTVVLSQDPGQDHIELATGSDEPAHFVLIAGRPLKESVVQYGPFVMTSQEEIRSTFEDYQQGRNGFERAVGWHASIDDE